VDESDSQLVGGRHRISPPYCYGVPMYIHSGIDFEWDPRKAERNLAKHGVDFADAVEVLFDTLAVTVVDEDPAEERFVTIGADGLNRILVVVYTWHGERVRIISARRAMRRERTQYEGVR